MCDAELAGVPWTRRRKQKQQKKTGKAEFTKLENFCASEDGIHRMKRQLTGWENIVANYTTGKGLMPRTYEEPT